jgi:hypothetical protein
VLQHLFSAELFCNQVFDGVRHGVLQHMATL